MSMAVVMSEMPDVWRKVLTEHVPDERRYCRACFHDGGRASWPCQTYRIAQEAKWVAEGGLPGTGPHGPGPSRTRLSPPEPAPANGYGRYRDEPPAAPPVSSHPSTGDWASPASSGWSGPSAPSGARGPGLDRPLAGNPPGPGPAFALSGERPYGSAPAHTRERPYGSDPAYTGDRPYGSDPAYTGERPYGSDPAYTGERPYGSDPAYTRDRPYGSGSTSGEGSYGPGSAISGEPSYGSTFDAPYGSSFGVDDRPRASGW